MSWKTDALKDIDDLKSRVSYIEYEVKSDTFHENVKSRWELKDEIAEVRNKLDALLEHLGCELIVPTGGYVVKTDKKVESDG